jgi:hypothetical protein
LGRFACLLLLLFVFVGDSFQGTISVGTILGIDSQRLDSFGDFCGRARRLDSKVKESIQNRHDSFA